jgi:ribosomal protein S18 acetylase RimI-like enzyme
MTTQVALSLDDLHAIARLHTSGISTGFLPQLGEKFLVMMYEAIAADQRCVLEVHRAEGKVVGFVAGSVGLKEVRTALVGQPLRLATALLPALNSFDRVKKLAQTVLHVRRKKPVANCPDAELLSIVVSDQHQRQGVAKLLYLQLVGKFRERGEREFCIVVGGQLSAAHNFYLAMGATVLSEIQIHDAMPSTIYVHHIYPLTLGPTVN